MLMKLINEANAKAEEKDDSDNDSESESENDDASDSASSYEEKVIITYNQNFQSTSQYKHILYPRAHQIFWCSGCVFGLVIFLHLGWMGCNKVK